MTTAVTEEKPVTEKPKKTAAKKKVQKKWPRPPLDESTAKYKVKLTFINPILGSAPANRDIYAKFVATKKQDATEDQITAESELIPAIPFDAQTGKMIFRVDPKTKAKIFVMHQIKGFLKEACKNTLANEITAYRSKIDSMVHISPDTIPLMRNGEIITEADTNERPLRAQTPLGPRVTLVSSEELTDCTAEFVVEVIPMGMKDFHKHSLDYIFQYGAKSGISQWRSAGYGRFTFELIPLNKQAELHGDEVEVPEEAGEVV
jgi:hypothetical protein